MRYIYFGLILCGLCGFNIFGQNLKEGFIPFSLTQASTINPNDQTQFSRFKDSGISFNQYSLELVKLQTFLKLNPQLSRLLDKAIKNDASFDAFAQDLALQTFKSNPSALSAFYSLINLNFLDSRLLKIIDSLPMPELIKQAKNTALTPGKKPTQNPAQDKVRALLNQLGVKP